MEEKYIEKIKQELLIKSILNRQQYEQDSMVEAAKKLQNKKGKNYESIQKNILNKKIIKEEKRHKNQIEERRRILREVESAIQLDNIKRRQEDLRRKQQVEVYMEELRTKWQRKENEKLRKKEKIKEEKLTGFVKQLNDLKNRTIAERRNIKTANNTNENKNVKQLSAKKEENNKKTNGERYIITRDSGKIVLDKERKSATTKRDNISLFSFIKENNKKEKKNNNGRISKVINAYQNSMNFYWTSFLKSPTSGYNYDKPVGKNVVNNKKKAQKSFIESIKYEINHKKALENNRNNNVRPRYVPRTH